MGFPWYPALFLVLTCTLPSVTRGKDTPSSDDILHSVYNIGILQPEFKSCQGSRLVPYINWLGKVVDPKLQCRCLSPISQLLYAATKRSLIPLDSSDLVDTPMSIEDAQTLDYLKFFKRYVLNSRPVIIRNVVQHSRWQVGQWKDDEYLVRRSGNSPVFVEQSHNRVFYYNESGTYDVTTMYVDEFLRHARDRSGAGTSFYLTGWDIRNEAPGLYEDVTPLPAISRLLQNPETMLWFGFGHQVSPLHCDVSENIFTVVQGSKHVVLYDHGATNFLRPQQAHRQAAVMSFLDLVHTPIARSPIARLAWELRTVVHICPGDALFIPSRVWHGVRSYGRNIAVATWFTEHSGMLGPIYEVLRDAIVPILSDEDG